MKTIEQRMIELLQNVAEQCRPCRACQAPLAFVRHRNGKQYGPK